MNTIIFSHIAKRRNVGDKPLVSMVMTSYNQKEQVLKSLNLVLRTLYSYGDAET